MKTVIYQNSDDLTEIKTINQLLARSFPNSRVRVQANAELLCRVVVYAGSEAIAHGIAYTREMKQGEQSFKGGIIGEIAVHPDYRRQGLCKQVIRSLDSVIERSGAQHSFLFAYEPEIYHSSGYRKLSLPIHFYDLPQERWNTTVFQGCMYKSFGDSRLKREVINFNGWVY